MEPVPTNRVLTLGVLGGSSGMVAGLFVASSLGALRGVPLDWPLRLGASLVLGSTALHSSGWPADVVGLLVLAALGAMGGIWFAFLCDWFPGLAETPGTLVLAGLTYAELLWLIGFYIFGFLLWPWLTSTDPVTYFLAATAGGASLGAGLVLAGVHRSRRLD